MKYYLIFLLIISSCNTATNKENELQPCESHRQIFQKGVATWYGPGFHQRKTSTGESYDMYDFTAAHRTLPFGTLLRVSNVENGRWVIVRVNDRGPVQESLILDLSKIAASQIGLIAKGSTKVEIEILGIGNNPLEKIFMFYRNLAAN